MQHMSDDFGSYVSLSCDGKCVCFLFSIVFHVEISFEFSLGSL